MERLGIIGYGAIARHVWTLLHRHRDVEVDAVLARKGQADRAAAMASGAMVVESAQALPDTLTAVLECAGHDALRTHGPAILERGIDLISVSVGALADDELEHTLNRAASGGGARLSFVAGAIGGLDVLSAARHGGLSEVVYTGRKPPAGWRGTAAEAVLDLGSLTAPATHFEGNARTAARRYPKNANVAASVALAGVGLEATKVTLIADPHAAGNTHEVEASGAFGTLSLSLTGHALADNPKSSALTAMSVVEAALVRGRALRVG
ncbi:MAG: aspartate dehydrogenase [Pseudomonadota bacterium]